MIRIGMSTSAVYPLSPENAFRLSRLAGFDGVEVMVTNDEVTQDARALLELSERYEQPILSIHAPVLLLTHFVWGRDPRVKLERSAELARSVGASTVVVHPPFRWQRGYAQAFVDGLARMEEETDVVFAVENMFPWRALSKEITAYAPGWDVREEDYAHTTVDLSHTSVSRTDALALVDDLGSRVAHVHLADGSGSARDEHLVPGRGTQPVAEVLRRLSSSGFGGSVIVEVSTRQAESAEDRSLDLAEALAFARAHIAPMAG